MLKEKIVLTIAGSDPSGGAGIQADIKTIERHGLYPCSVVTVITAQNATEFTGQWPLDSHIVQSQLESILKDCHPEAVKIGMLGNVESIKSIASLIKSFNLDNIVLDPLLSPTLRQKEVDNSFVDSMIKELIPLATIVTPNLKEKEIIEKATGEDLVNLCNSLLVKGGHSDKDEIKDVLYIKDKSPEFQQISSSAFPTISFGHSRLYDSDSLLPPPDTDQERIIVKEFNNKRIKSSNTHGTGCILSSAIACNLASGYHLEKAVSLAIKFTNNAIRKASDYHLFKGEYGPALV